MEQLDCIEVVAHDGVENVRRRCTAFRRQQAAGPLRRAPKAAPRGETEFREMPPRRLQLTAQAVGIVHMVDGAEINLRVRRPQSFERCEKRVVRSTERRQMQEIDAAPGGRNRRRVQQYDGAAEIRKVAAMASRSACRSSRDTRARPLARWPA